MFDTMHYIFAQFVSTVGGGFVCEVLVPVDTELFRKFEQELEVFPECLCVSVRICRHMCCFMEEHVHCNLWIFDTSVFLSNADMDASFIEGVRDIITMSHFGERS